jgi:hypothetical protein
MIGSKSKTKGWIRENVAAPTMNPAFARESWTTENWETISNLLKKIGSHDLCLPISRERHFDRAKK